MTSILHVTLSADFVGRTAASARRLRLRHRSPARERDRRPTRGSSGAAGPGSRRGRARGTAAPSAPRSRIGGPRAWRPSTVSGKRCRRCAGSPGAAPDSAGCTCATTRRGAGDGDTRALRGPTARGGGSARRGGCRRTRRGRRTSDESAGRTKANRAFRSGFAVRASCRSRISGHDGTARTASSSASVMKSGSSSTSPGTVSVCRQTRLEPFQRVRRLRRVAERGEPGGFQAGGRGGGQDPGAAHPRASAPSAFREESGRNFQNPCCT